MFCRNAEAVVAAADPGGLTLFAGIAAQPLPDDLPARALQLAATCRELRGSAHLVAVRASGLPSHVAHFLRRPDDYATFGWGDVAPEVTDDDRAALDRAEALTDVLVMPAWSVVDDDEADPMAAVVTDMGKALAG